MNMEGPVELVSFERQPYAGGMLWTFKKGEFFVDLLAKDFPTYELAKAEFERACAELEATPEWRRGISQGQRVYAMDHSRREAAASRTYRIVAFNDETRQLVCESLE